MKSRSNSNHIAGIYNYCDRWCERCSFTAKCAVYENTSDLTPEQLDIKNKAFWETLSKNISDAFEMMQEAAKKNGIEIEPLTDTEWEAYKKNEKAGRINADKHPLIKYAKNYSKLAILFFEKNELLKSKGEELVHHTTLGIKQFEDAKNELTLINDCFEILQWYVYLIHVKFLRAMPMMPGEDKDETFISDSNGSAKVALIGADRCILAWQQVLAYLPNAEDDILPMLALLQKIITTGEKTFPDARKFKRVGLDE